MVGVYTRAEMIRPVLYSVFILGTTLGCGAAQAPAGPASALSESSASDLRDGSRLLRIDRPAVRGGGTAQSILTTLQSELNRTLAELKRQETPPYYLAYHVDEAQAASFHASQGLLVQSQLLRGRVLTVSVRVGSHQLDNTHGEHGFASPMSGLTLLPIEEKPLALRMAVWRGSERAYQQAIKALIEVRAAKTVEAEEEDVSPDFSRERPVQHIEPTVSLRLRRAEWEDRTRRLSGLFRKHPQLEQSYVKLEAGATNRYFVSSEQTVLQTHDQTASLSFGAQITSQDGMILTRDETLRAHNLARLPSESEIAAAIGQLMAELLALHASPLGEPYIGPAILDGKAAAVLFHEVLGHRAEGHRQKQKSEGKTFRKMVGERVMPRGFDVFDDPRIQRINGVDLSGFYSFDDEGVAAQPVRLVQDGIFRGFLMSRTPISGFDHSNGHGRAQFGMGPVARQANLVVQPHRVTTSDALKRQLLAAIRRQGKPYGLRVSKVTGGDTQTGVWDPQAFQVRPVLVYRVFPDGHEELVRGVKLEGTPLSLLANVVAAADDYAVFNGVCVAESGQVPVSAVSPSLLVSRIEIARAPKGSERPPLLPPPPAVKGGASP
jgi:TldD protein